MSKKIPLSRGLFTIIDDEDFAYLNQWKWFAHRDQDGRFYANRNIRTDLKSPRQTSLVMSRVIMKRHRYEIEGLVVDHIDRDTLDNRKKNLRVCTDGQNQCNAIGKGKKTSKYKGVCFYKRIKKWQATIQFKHKHYNLGYFDREIDAAKIYNEAALGIHGEYARINNI